VVGAAPPNGFADAEPEPNPDLPKADDEPNAPPDDVLAFVGALAPAPNPKAVVDAVAGAVVEGAGLSEPAVAAVLPNALDPLEGVCPKAPNPPEAAAPL
jgi:hypothetical protein